MLKCMKKKMEIWIPIWMCMYNAVQEVLERGWPWRSLITTEQYGSEHHNNSGRPNLPVGFIWHKHTTPPPLHLLLDVGSNPFIYPKCQPTGWTVTPETKIRDIIVIEWRGYAGRENILRGHNWLIPIISVNMSQSSKRRKYTHLMSVA